MSKLANGSKVDIMKGYHRMGAFPLDDTCVFMSYTEANNYVKSSRSYLGQIIVVLNDDNPDADMNDYKGTSVAYMIDYANNLIPIHRDAYYSKNAIIAEINELTKVVEEARIQLEEALYKTGYIKYTEVIGYQNDTDNGTMIRLLFTYGNNQIDLIDIKLDPKYFKVSTDENFTRQVELGVSDYFKTLEETIFDNQIRITKLEENLDAEINRATEAEDVLRNELDIERQRLTSEANKLQEEINRSKNAELDLLNAHNTNVTRLDEHQNIMDNMQEDINSRVKIETDEDSVTLYNNTDSIEVATISNVNKLTNIGLNRPVTTDIGNYTKGQTPDSSVVNILENILYKDIEPTGDIEVLIGENINHTSNIIDSELTINAIGGTLIETRYPIEKVELKLSNDTINENIIIGNTVTTENVINYTPKVTDMIFDTIYAESYHGYANVIFTPIEHATSYKVTYSNYNGTFELPKDLIYKYKDKYCATIINEPGIYSVSVKAVDHNIETECISTLDNVGILPYDKSGYAEVTGGYAENNIILYITQDNFNTVNLNNHTGLYDILKNRDTTPMIIRIVGELDLPNKIVIDNQENLTIEGIGPYSCINTSIHVTNSKNIEINNLAILNTIEDCIILDKNENIFIHHVDFYYGQTGNDLDQLKGTGSLSIKESKYITIAYNHFIDSGKVALIDSQVLETDYSDYITFHHNWFEYCDSNAPYIRNSKNVHLYNNYYDNVLMGICATSGSSVLAERNIFTNCKYPILSSMQGTDETLEMLSKEDGGIVKSFENIFDNSSIIDYSENNTSFDVYTVSDLSEQIPEEVVTLQGQHSYSNFEIPYEYTSDEPNLDMISLSGNLFDIEYHFTSEDSCSNLINQDLKSEITTYKSSISYKFADINLEQFTIPPRVELEVTKDILIENLNTRPCTPIEFTVALNSAHKIDSDLHVELICTTSNGITSIEKTFNVVNPIYFGYIQPDETLSTEHLSELNRLISGFGLARNNDDCELNLSITCNKKSIIIAYPVSYGELKQIIDPNNFNILEIFDTYTIEINDISYQVYQSDIQTLSNYNILLKI